MDVTTCMRRTRRLVDGARYHVIARANRREFILESDRMKEMLLTVIARARCRFRFSIDTLCIMDNHIHLLLRPGEGESLSRIMQWILSVFAVRFNRAFGLQGHVWYDRFKSVVIGGLPQFAHAYSYIRENPVVAGIVAHAREYGYGGAGVRRSGMSRILGPPGPLARLLFPEELGRNLLPPPYPVP